MTVAADGLSRWHAHMEGARDRDSLAPLLAEDAVFHSPVVHTPQEGKAIVLAYLGAADKVLGGDSFTYVQEIVSDRAAMLEFTCKLDGIHINGVDIIEWNDAGLIQDFKVMVRPLKAINKVWEEMGKMLGG